MFALSDTEYKRLCADLEIQAEELIETILKREKIIDTRIPDMINILHSVKPRFRNCSAGKSLLAVSASGEIYPCHRFVGDQDWILGNYTHLDHHRRENFIGHGIDESNFCHLCWARYLCGGGCMHHNFALFGRIDHPDPRQCRQIKRCAEMAIYVADHLNDEDMRFLQKN
jgi:uncharacterized protein